MIIKYICKRSWIWRNHWLERGDQWYQPNGTAVSGGNVIFNGGVVYPRYVDRENRVLDIQDPNFKPEYSFDDYQASIEPHAKDGVFGFQFQMMMPTSFAHYDVLYQRPPSNSILTALDYFTSIMQVVQGVQNNPNLRPVRTVSYEAGFQQKVSQFAAIKMSAYYKENKDSSREGFIPTYLHRSLLMKHTETSIWVLPKDLASSLISAEPIIFEFSATYTPAVCRWFRFWCQLIPGVSIPGHHPTSTHFLLTKDTDLQPISITGTNQVKLMTDQRLVVSTFWRTQVLTST